jgi:lipopolysaccharide/colanic/teichoic acid biosynthesis glycosyltransferase
LKPKVLIATTVPETLATILKGQPERLSELFEVAVVSSAGEHFETIAAPTIRRFTVNMHRGISPWADLKSIVSMVSVLRRFKPDVMHAYTPKAGLVCMVAGFICRVPVRVHTFTGLIFPTTSNRLKQWVLKQVDALICVCATTVVAEGVGVKNDLLRFKVTHKSIQIIGHGNIAGLDSGYFDAQLPVVIDAVAKLNQQHAADNAFIFLYVGRLNRDKGLKELAAAFVGLESLLPLDHSQESSEVIRFNGSYKLPINPPIEPLVEALTQPPTKPLIDSPINSPILWLAGSLDQSAPPDASTLNILNNHPQIQKMGFLQDIRGVLARCDVLVLPSYREGFPNVLLQAGAMQKPAIATDINGSNEIVIPTETGWLVPPKDGVALERAMLLAMQTPEIDRLAMGRTARQRIQALYEREPYIQTLMAFYQQLLRPLSTPAPVASRLVKRLVDITAAFSLLCLLGLPLLALAMWVRIKLGSPVLFTQTRPGLDGKPFKMFKFRTMTDARGAEGELLDDAQRLTPFGMLLRRTSLDELPELWNVLTGDMSLVGPRPLLMQYLPLYTPQQARRHDVRPGITGWAQINGRNAISWEQKFDFDVWYVEKTQILSAIGLLRLDIKILWLTLRRVFKQEGISAAKSATMPPFVGSALKNKKSDDNSLQTSEKYDTN